MRPASLAAAAVGGANLAVERNEFVLTTAHADYAIEVDADGGRLLRVNGQNASREDGAGTGHPYIEWIEERVYDRTAPGDRRQRVLVIGAGGFTFGRGRPENAAEIVYVDVDDRLPGVADEFLAPLSRSGTYVPMDGRAYLLRDDDVYDAIVLDAFTDRTTMPAHLYTREFFELVRSRLAGDGGSLYMNLIVPPGRIGCLPGSTGRCARCSRGATLGRSEMRPGGTIASTPARGVRWTATGRCIPTARPVEKSMRRKLSCK